MIDLDKYADAAASNYNKEIINEMMYRMGDSRLKIDNNQTFLISFRGDTYSNARHAFIYKYKEFDKKEIRFIIACGKHEVSINVKENGYGGIEVRDTVLDRPYGENILDLGFCDDKYHLYKYKEKRNSFALTQDIASVEESIPAEDWSVERVLEEINRAVRIAWNDEEWFRFAEMIFNVIKPAIALAINEDKDKWVDYLNKWSNKYQKMIDSGKLDEEQIKKYKNTCELYNKTVEILESKEEFKVKTKKRSK